MRSVGTRLLDARTKKGITLDEISARTRINSKNLNAIESDSVNNISSPFLYRSFVRQYAEAVGLDFKTLAPGVEMLAAQMRQPDLPGQGEHQIVRVAPIQPRLKRDWSWVLPAAVLLAIVSSGSGAYAYLKYYNPNALRDLSLATFFPKTSKPVLVAKETHTSPVAAQHAATPATDSKPAPVPEDFPPAKSQIQPASVPPAPDLPKAEPAETYAQSLAAQSASFQEKPVVDKIHLELAATERTSLSVSADGKTAYTGILEPAETKVLDGQETAKLRTGNAGGVNIIFNGKAIGSIGPRGKTRTVIFSKTGYEIEAAGGSTVTTSTHIGG